MIDRSAIYDAAAGCREAIGLAPNATAVDVCERAVEHLELDVEIFKEGGVRGPGVLGTLCWENGQIHVAARLAPPEAAFVTAHEIGHYVLHPGAGTHFDRSAADRSAPHGTHSAMGYSERERLELDADAFAMELLCPAAWLRDRLSTPGTTPTLVAAQIGLPPGLVLDHAVHAALMREPGRPRGQGSVIPLSPAQAGLATDASGHLFIDVRPGVGATVMAAARVDHLLRSGSKPTSVVALAPSEGMVADLRRRIAALRSGDIGLAWTGTPAGFGFEVVAKHADLIGRPRDFRLLDETGAFARFDEERRRIAPGLRARASFLATFEAKARLVDPAAWSAMADRDRRLARTAADRSRAAEVAELGRVYGAYEHRLAREGAVDAADLASMPVRLLERDPGLLAAAGRPIEHVVIDGAQDLGPSALRMVRLLAKAGATIWAVGDPGRCIMRYAGARPGTMAETARSLGARRVSVTDDNARRVPTPALSRTVDARCAPVTGSPAAPACSRASRHANSEQEALAIAQRIRMCVDRGIAPCEQVLLARSHHVLKAVVRTLELRGVTVAVVADLRSERVVGDLLAVAALATDQAGEIERARVLCLPEYAIPEADLGLAREWLLTRVLPPTKRVSRAGRAGLTRLARDFDGLGRGTSAASVMKSWLFERSGYLARLREDADETRRNRAMASLHHLVRIAEEHEAQRDDDHARLDRRVRRAGGLRQQSAFSSATTTGGHDAVAAMTIHAARGHAFRVVHLAGVLDGRMPVRSQRNEAPWPREFATEAADLAGAADAELALLRVAASRATERLYVSGAESYGSDTPRA